MLDMEIRRPTADDVLKVSAFFRTVVTDTFRKEGIGDLVADREEEIRTKENYLRLDLESNGEDRCFLIAVVGDDIVGTIEFGPASELILRCTDGSYVGLMEVGTVFVHPDLQGQGVGNRLLKAIFSVLHTRGFEEFCLDSGYRGSQAVWRHKFGEPEYWLKDYWGDGADHMIWRLKIRDLI
ncbi:GNAT family N-acetyltransferase [Cohnella thailandensis]|uniref:GNAT family N-acetyltransferase n=1 Tax=Cohnella thailandensis TaxID=557557 RepID=A0A841SY52_9BACL|nr:GNAT family N-acetyltransferase [Cohnella thailandensis]MBB6636834.1 GNAT family N-acetyltransferase [Cohnella thailandensis]